MNAIECSGLAKRYGRTWALKECSLAVPGSHIVALVGPNGAGKTTLLQLATGLSRPTTGSITVLDHVPAGSLDALERVAFVAQDAPLYQHLPVAAMVALAEGLNPRFERIRAARRLLELDIDLHRKVGKLSGGQQAQLALTLALARRPELLILDEPLARLDPLAQHDFMAALMVATVEDGLSVMFSSHVVAELERVADYVVVLASGRLQVAGDIADLLGGHSMLTGPAGEAEELAARLAAVQVRPAGRQARVLVRRPAATPPPAGWESDEVSLEELILAYLRAPSASALPGPVGPSEGRAADGPRDLAAAPDGARRGARRRRGARDRAGRERDRDARRVLPDRGLRLPDVVPRAVR